MDPEETYKLMMDAYHAGEIDEAHEHAENFLNWISQGGFLPSPSIKACVIADIKMIMSTEKKKGKKKGKVNHGRHN